MSILSRFGDIIAANINELLDKAEDPAKMFDQYLRKANEDLAEVKKETAAVMAEEKRCKRNLDSCNEEINKYTELAKKAITAGNDDDAKVFIQKKQEAESRLASAQQAYDVAAANSAKMRQMHDKLTNDIAALNARRNNIKATVAVAKTQERVNRVTSAATNAAGALDNFSRMENKANEMLDRAMAEAELNNPAASDPAADIEKKYTGGGSVSVDDELARMKAELGV